MLSDDLSYYEVASSLDVYNTANMFTINIICCNTGWSFNNAFLWRPNEEGGRWRWIMKDMDVIGFPYLCRDALKFDYLKYFTNTSGSGSQESGVFLTASWMSDRVEFLGRLINLPEFRNELVDRLMVYMGDFMHSDVIQRYLEEQYEIMNTEVTQSFLMLKTGGTNSLRDAINSYVKFFRERPAGKPVRTLINKQVLYILLTGR